MPSWAATQKVGLGGGCANTHHFRVQVLENAKGLKDHEDNASHLVLPFFWACLQDIPEELPDEALSVWRLVPAPAACVQTAARIAPLRSAPLVRRGCSRHLSVSQHQPSTTKIHSAWFWR